MSQIKATCRILVPIAVAALLWFYMFSPWTAGFTNFWLTMTFAALVLTTLSLLFSKGEKVFPNVEKCFKNIVLQILLGIVIAFVLWGIFWLGDKISQWMFDFARPQVNAVCGMKTGLPENIIAVLLLLVIGPAEEFFWRGFVQREMVQFLPSREGVFSAENVGFVLTTVIYALVHIWSFNFMLVMAALVAGFIWGLLYRLRPSLLPALIVSHAVWDALVFVILPIM